MSQKSNKPEESDLWPVADLHCHSCYSDGQLSPGQLIDYAQERGIKVLALTDHDTVDGVHDLFCAAEEKGVTAISGTELTCSWGKRVVHIVGLGFDIRDTQFKAYLERLDQLRAERAQLISERLVKKGLPGLLERALELSGDGQIGRPHFATAMVEAGIVSSENQAFNKYLGSGKAGDVKVSWPDLQEGIDIIHAAGGLAVLAHPTKYNLSFTKLRLLVDAFSAQGGDAIEISYPGIESGHILQLDKLATKHKLLVSAGSDFHKPQFHWTGLGKYPRFKSENDDVLSVLLK